MIVSDRGFVIATPTKCGTTTLEEMCRRHRGGRAQPGLPSFRIMDWEMPRRQHRMALPVDGSSDDADRYIMVRDPFARYVSMYEYLRAPHNYSKFGAREIQGRDWAGVGVGRLGLRHKPLTFERFLVFMTEQRLVYSDRRWLKRRGDLASPFAYRSPWVWLDPLDTSVACFGGASRAVWVEQFWPSMSAIKARYGVESLSVRPTIHANRTLTYGDHAVADYWNGVGSGVRYEVGVDRESALIREMPTLVAP